jgi:hypothetical protein
MGRLDAIGIWFCDFSGQPPRYLSWVVTPLVFAGVIVFCAVKYFFSVSFPLLLAGTLGVILINNLPPVTGLIALLLLMGLAVLQVRQTGMLRAQVSRLESELEDIQIEQKQGQPARPGKSGPPFNPLDLAL